MDYHGQGSFIEWLIPVARSGIYDVTVRYASGPPSDRPLDLHVDDKVIQYAMQMTTNWNTWDTETHTIEIGAGMQTFRLIAVDSVGPNVDDIEVTKLNTLLGYNAHGVYDGDQWHIARTDISTEFRHGDSPELIIQYEVYKNILLDQVETSVYTIGCSTPAEGVVSVAGSFVTQEQASDPDLKTFVLQIDIDEPNLVTSNIWEGNVTEGTIMMCVRVELIPYSLNPELVSLSYLETILLQHVVLSASFGMEPFGVAEVVDEIFMSEADVQFLVSSCVCADDLSCLESPETFKVNSALHLCVYSNSEKVQIHGISEMKLEQEDLQNNGLTLFTVVEESNPHPLAKVEIVHDSEKGDVASVQTRLITAFFENDEPEDILVSGKVDLVFVTSGRRQAFLLSRSVYSEDEIHADFQTTIGLSSANIHRVGLIESIIAICLLTSMVA
jgi:hypothetical protein